MIDVDEELKKHESELIEAVKIAGRADAIFYIDHDEVSDNFFVYLEKFYFDQNLKVSQPFSHYEPYENNIVNAVGRCIKILDDCCNEMAITKIRLRNIDLLRSDHIWLDIQKPIVSKDMITEKRSAFRFLPHVKVGEIIVDNLHET